MQRQVHPRRRRTPAIRIVAGMLCAAACAVGWASARPTPALAASAQATMRIKALGNYLRVGDANGAIQDTHWFLNSPANPNDPCSAGRSAAGEQLIDLHAPNQLFYLTFHADGVITPRWFAVPATLRRTATDTIDTSSINPAACPGVGTNTDATGSVHTENFDELSPLEGGCGSIDGTAVLHMALHRDQILINGYFTRDPVVAGLGSVPPTDPLPACPFFLDAVNPPAEKNGVLIRTTWTVNPYEIFHPSTRSIFFRLNGYEGETATTSYPGNPHGATVTSISIIFVRRQPSSPRPPRTPFPGLPGVPGATAVRGVPAPTGVPGPPTLPGGVPSIGGQS